MIKELRPLAQELLVSTALHYNSGNRAMGEGYLCVYRMEDGRRCAAGRMMTDAGAAIAAEQNTKNLVAIRNSFTDANNPGGFVALFQEKWHALVRNDDGLRFVRSVQRFHDDRMNWNEAGLSGNGLRTIETICEDHSLSIVEVMALLPIKDPQ